MISPIGPYLAEFRPLSAVSSILVPPLPVPHHGETEEEAGPRQTLTSQIDAARHEGAAEATDNARQAHAAAIAAMQSRHAIELAEDRQRWTQSEGAALSAAIERGLTELERRIADSLAGVLAPLLPDIAMAKAIDELRGTIAALLSDDEHRAIEVSGPADLIGALSSAYGERRGIAFTSAAVTEVTIRAGETRIETQVQRWAAALSAARGDPS